MSKSRYFFTTEEMSFVQRIALRYGLSRQAYVEACLKDLASRDRLIVIPLSTKRTCQMTVDLPAEVAIKAKKDADDMGVKNLPSYVRQRLLGGLTYSPPRLGGLRLRTMSALEHLDLVQGRPARRGRPRLSDYLFEVSKGGALDTLLLDGGRTRELVEAIFQQVASAGIVAGDVGSLMEYLSCLISSDIVMAGTSSSDASDPHSVQGTKSKRQFVAWSSIHGRVLIERPPSDEKRSGLSNAMKRMQRSRG